MLARPAHTHVKPARPPEVAGGGCNRSVSRHGGGALFTGPPSAHQVTLNLCRSVGSRFGVHRLGDIRRAVLERPSRRKRSFLIPVTDSAYRIMPPVFPTDASFPIADRPSSTAIAVGSHRLAVWSKSNKKRFPGSAPHPPSSQEPASSRRKATTLEFHPRNVGHFESLLAAIFEDDHKVVIVVRRTKAPLRVRNRSCQHNHPKHQNHRADTAHSSSSSS